MFQRITLTLRDDLHWLPVPEGIVFKLCTIIFKCLHQTAPQYPQEMCVPVTASSSRRHLRSATRGNLNVLACRTSSFEPCSFAACDPKLWNNLPSSLYDPTLTLHFSVAGWRHISSVQSTDVHLWLTMRDINFSHTWIHRHLEGCGVGGAVSPVGVAPTRTVDNSASIIFPCSIKIQKTGGGETQPELC